jgi:hypothetical protein
MFGIFKKIIGKSMEPGDFKTGMVIEMKPGYYTKKPYYVLIKSVSKTGIVTTIPTKHDLELDKINDIATWNHQTARMKIIGNQETHGHLLYNQRLKS